MLTVVVVILLVLLLGGGGYGYFGGTAFPAHYGYWGGGLGLVLFIVLVLFLLGRL